MAPFVAFFVILVCIEYRQQKLDVFADSTFMRILTAGKSVAGIGSEEQENYILCGDEGRQGKYVVMIDPLDGSSNIDVNVSIGTIFSIYRRITPLGEPLKDDDFLQPGRRRAEDERDGHGHGHGHGDGCC